MSTFLGTFGTETFRRAKGGKFVVPSDSGKPVFKTNWASFSTCKRWHRNQSEVQGRAGLRDFFLWPIPLRLSKMPDSLVTFKMPTPKLDPTPGRGPGLAALLSHRPKHWQGLPIPGTGPNESSAGGANLTWASSRAGVPCLGIGACLKGALGLVIMVCGSCLLATVSCSC